VGRDSEEEKVNEAVGAPSLETESDEGHLRCVPQEEDPLGKSKTNEEISFCYFKAMLKTYGEEGEEL